MKDKTFISINMYGEEMWAEVGIYKNYASAKLGLERNNPQIIITLREFEKIVNDVKKELKRIGGKK